MGALVVLFTIYKAFEEIRLPRHSQTLSDPVSTPESQSNEQVKQRCRTEKSPPTSRRSRPKARWKSQPTAAMAASPAPCPCWTPWRVCSRSPSSTTVLPAVSVRPARPSTVARPTCVSSTRPARRRPTRSWSSPSAASTRSRLSRSPTASSWASGLVSARSTVRATPVRSSTAHASSSRTGVRSRRSARSCSTTSRPSSKKLLVGPLVPSFPIQSPSHDRLYHIFSIGLALRNIKGNFYASSSGTATTFREPCMEGEKGVSAREAKRLLDVQYVYWLLCESRSSVTKSGVEEPECPNTKRKEIR